MAELVVARRELIIRPGEVSSPQGPVFDLGDARYRLGPPERFQPFSWPLEYALSQLDRLKYLRPTLNYRLSGVCECPQEYDRG